MIYLIRTSYRSVECKKSETHELLRQHSNLKHKIDCPGEFIWLHAIKRRHLIDFSQNTNEKNLWEVVLINSSRTSLVFISCSTAKSVMWLQSLFSICRQMSLSQDSINWSNTDWISALAHTVLSSSCDLLFLMLVLNKCFKNETKTHAETVLLQTELCPLLYI